jgi:hypothetical protein
VIVSANRRVDGACRRPTVRAGIVSPASVRIRRTAPRTMSAPDDHFVAGPYCGMRVSLGRCVSSAGSCPTIPGGVICAAGVCIIERFIDAAPDNHFAAGPDRRVNDSAKRHIDNTRRHPTIVSGIVSAASMQIRMVRDRVSSTPDDHFTARPDCGVIPSCGRHVDCACRRPTVRAGIVSSAGV